MSQSDRIPTHGVRVLLELEEATADSVAYRVELIAPSVTHASRATIAIASGELSLDPWRTERGEGEPEAWAIDSARAFLRTLHKNHAEERDWPRRQLRWRERRAGA